MNGNGDVVVITGASAGIGAALARTLGAEGKRLVLASRRETALREVADDATARGAADVIIVQTDVTKRDEVFRLRDATIARLGRFDVWVNNAGQGIVRNVLDLSDEDIDSMLAVNLRSAIYGMQAAVPHFMERGTGHLINISSMLGRVPMATFRSIYSASKAALNSLTANLRMDLRAKYPGVHVSLVMPGVVSTDFWKNVRGEPRLPMDGLAATDSFPRPQSPEEVAQSIASVIRDPTAEVYTHPSSPEMARRYMEDPGAFQDRFS